jgi:hypothetical protein
VQPGVTDEFVEVLHEQDLVEYGQSLQLDRFLARGAGLGEPPAVERRVRSGVARHGLQALLLVGGQLGAGSLLAADLGPGHPQGRRRIGQAPPVIANLAVHRVLRSCFGRLLPAGAWAAPRTASDSSHPMRRPIAPSTACGWVNRSRPSPSSIAFQASTTVKHGFVSESWDGPGIGRPVRLLEARRA